MSRALPAILSTTILLGLTLSYAPVRAAAVCDVNACISTRCKRAMGNNAQTCNSGCQIDVAENKKKWICK
jgi:hypothetical protein